MPEIKNTFLKGRMNKDLDERLIPNGEYRDALNITVSTSEDSDVGAVQTLLSNVRVEDIIPADFMCVGSIADEKNNTLYWFVKNQVTGVDAIVEYGISSILDIGSFTNIVFVDAYANTDNPVLRFPSKIITGINIIDDLLFWTDGEGEPKKININTCKQGTIQLPIANALSTPVHTKLIVLNDDLGDIQEEDITVIKKKPTNAPVAIPTFTKSLDASYSSKTSLFEKVFSRFAFRYKYQDNEYSAFGPFSNVVFNPEYVSNPHRISSSNSFVNYDNNNSYSIKEPFNASMVNKIDTIDVYNFIAADIPRGVVEVEILYKQENSPVIYSIAKLNKKDIEGYWDLNGFNEGSNITTSGYRGKYTIVTENIYAALPENQFIRVFDTVPKKALAQEITGNRLVYANYTQGYDIGVDSIKILADYETRINNTTFDFSPQKSLKSLRNYQVGIVFGDEYGRETPVFTYSEAAVSIPWQNGSGDFNASSSSSLKAQITSEYPSFASYFKFYIKETSTEYYNLIMDKAYVPTSQDEQDRSVAPDHIWISFFSSDRSKIDIEDHLILKKILNESIDGQETNNNKFKIIDVVNEAPESISYEFHDLAGISNDTGNLTSILDESGFSIIDETNTLVVDYSNFHNLTVGAGNVLGPREGFEDDKTANTQDMFISWYKINPDGSKEYSKDYRVRSIFTTDTTSYRIKLQKKITSDDATLADDGTGVINSDIIFNIFRKQKKELDQFSGRFFVKIIFDYVIDGVRNIIEDITQNYRSVASAKMKYWLNEVDNTSRDEKNKIVNVSPSTTSYNSAADATINGQVLHTGITNTQTKWNALYSHVTSGSTTDAFFIDNMYFVAGQARMSQRYARYAQDVIIGQSVGGFGSFYTYAEWTNELTSPVNTNHWFIYGIGFPGNNTLVQGNPVSYNYFDYVRLNTITGAVENPSAGTNTDNLNFTASMNSLNGLTSSSWNGAFGYNNIGGLIGVSNPAPNGFYAPDPISPSYRWYPFAKDASVGYVFSGGNTIPPAPTSQISTTGAYGQFSNGARTASASVNVNHPDLTSNPDWSDWNDYIVPVRTSVSVGSTDPGINPNFTFDPKRIVNSMEGIFVSTVDHTDGFKSWVDFPQSGVNPTNSVVYDNDNTYKHPNQGRVFMHLSFLGPGKDLVPDNLDLSSAEIQGPNCIGAYLQGIHGGGVFTKDRKDGLDNGWEFKSTSNWDSPQVIECESSSVKRGFAASSSAKGLDIGYDSNYQSLHDTQWKPVENINGDSDSKIQEFLFQLFFPRSRFRFKDDSDNVIYTIKSVTKKFLYNHTPWKRRYVKKSFVTGSDSFLAASDFSDDTYMEPRGDSVEEAAVAWAKAKENGTGNLGTKTNELETKIKNFGKANNRRVVYILELVDENDNPLNPTAQAYNPVDANSSGSGIVAENNTAQIEFVNYAPGIARGKISNNAAIWETEPRENKNLEVYYEASSAIPTQLNVDTAELYAPVGCRVEALNRIGSLDGQITLSECNITGYSEHTDGRLILETTGFNQLDQSGNTITYADPDPISGTTCMLKCIRNDGSYTMFLAVDSTIDQPLNLVSQFIVISQRSFDFGLNWYNCFSFGNGIESNRIRDEFNKMQITNGARASAVLNEPYDEENRKHGLIYSGIYNSTSSINNLNQFVIGDKITKDLNPTYGSIQKLFQRRISLVAFCEDRVVSITSNKDALFNADGKPQLISSTNVLGDATPFVGNYGISTNPESFASESYRAYFTDKQRGVVLRLSRDGITPISEAGMKDWFRDHLPLFNVLIGSYDSYSEDYNITLTNSDFNIDNLISNSYLSEGLGIQDEPNTTPNPEIIENTNFNNSTNSTWPLDLSDATVPQIINQDTPSVTVYINEYAPIPQGYFQQADNTVTPELFDVPPAPVPGFATVSYGVSGTFQLTDWNGLWSSFSTLGISPYTYGPASSPGSNSGSGGGPTNYSWYTPPTTPVDPNSYAPSDVAVIYSLNTFGILNNTVGGSPGGFQSTDYLNIDQASSNNAFDIGQIALSPSGGAELEADHYYLLDIIYDETTSPTGKIFITGTFDKDNPPADGLAPGNNGYLSGHFGITKDFGGGFSVYDALELQQVDRTTDLFGQFNYIAGQSSEESNVFRAIFKVDSNSRIMNNISPHKTTEINLAFEGYVGKIKKVVLKNIGSYDLWNQGSGYPANTSVDLPSVGSVIYNQGWVGHFNNLTYTPMYHAMSLPIQYVKNNEVNINNVPQQQYASEDTLFNYSATYARWFMGKHANAQFNYPIAHNRATNPTEAPQPTFDGYEIVFEVGNEYYTNTMGNINFLYRSFVVTDPGPNETYSKPGVLVKDIDTPGIYRIIANFDNSTTLPNGNPWSLELDTGNGFEEISNTSSAAVLTSSPGNNLNTFSWFNYYGFYIFYADGGNDFKVSIKSLSTTDRTTYISTISSADDWTFNGFEPTFNEQNIVWDNGSIIINSNNTVTPTRANITFPFVSAYQLILGGLNNGEFYRLRFDYEELSENQAPLIIYYYNSSNQGFEIQVPSGSGSYDEVLVIGSSNSTNPYQANVNNIVIIPSDSTSISHYSIDNILLQRAFTPLGVEPITVSFSEDVKGWVSFKSFIPEQALSLSKKYFSVKDGALYQHNVLESENVYNNFYGVQYDSSITAVLNAEPSVIKSFKTLNYEGTQAKVDKYKEAGYRNSGLLFQDLNNNLTAGDVYGTHYNIIDKSGWYVDNILTNKQEGFVNEFLEKEGKWFNYIKGTRKDGNLSQDYIAQHTGDLSFQGISVISGVTAVPSSNGNSSEDTGNGNGNGTEGSTPSPTGSGSGGTSSGGY
mgnify:CR=1 FL=1